MGLLTKEQVDQVWEDGLKYRLRRFHKYLLSFGLLPMSVPVYSFESHLKQLLVQFFVEGVREDDRGRPKAVSNRGSQEADDAEGRGTGGEAGASDPAGPRGTD